MFPTIVDVSLLLLISPHSWCGGSVCLAIVQRQCYFGKRELVRLTRDTLQQGGGVNVMKQMMDVFGDVEPFLENASVSPATVEKLLSVLRNPSEKARLMVELAVTIDTGYL